MVSALVNMLFSLIAKLGDIIISPLVLGLSALIPNFSTFYSSIVTYLGYGFQYLGFFIRALCIPSACITLVYTIAAATLSIAIFSRAYTLIIRIYNKFKF